MEEITSLALPNEQQFKADIQAINQFQKVVRANMIDGQDYGIIPSTSKPTLLKPGAEKIAKLLGLADHYEILDRQEDWLIGFFRYLIKCSLISVATGVTISEGLGECNSKESKYAYRWVGERDLPQGTDTTNLISQVRHSRTGGKWTVYRFDNEDIYSQVNTLLKMAKKRALVDAALSAGRLSQVFTQDIEDMAVIQKEDVTKPPPKKNQKGVEPSKELYPEDPPNAKKAAEPAQPVNKEQIDSIVTLLKEADMSLGALGKWMVEKGWTVRKLEDIVAWQYEEILEAFKKGE